MTASPPDPAPPAGHTLAGRIRAALGGETDPALHGPRRDLRLRDLGEHRFVDAPDQALHGRNLLIQTRDPLAAVAALTSLDGVAARLVLCPPDVGAAQLQAAMTAADVHALVSDAPDAHASPCVQRHMISPEPLGSRRTPSTALATEWVLFTSGTSGAPKLVGHSLAALTGAIPPQGALDRPPVWATFYDVRRYGGLQMLLRALIGGFDLFVTDPDEPMGGFLRRLHSAGATHVAGTPSHWRRVLMSPELQGLDPRYVRLSGEIADQPVLDGLHLRFPFARVGHAYASTEAGVGFEVTDGLAGFPAGLVNRRDGPVQMRVVDGVLHLRSPRTAHGYLGHDAERLTDAEGWVDTGDLVERRGERFYFLGRRSGIINVGGLKISPEEVEAVINACPTVRMSRVSSRASPVLGALVAAEVVLAADAEPGAARAEILAHCRTALPAYKAPASLRFVETLPVGAAGKLERRLA